MAQLQTSQRRAPGLIFSNSATTTKDNIFVYWCSPKGEIQPAADARIKESTLQSWPEYRHWRRIEAHGAKEIEKVSLIIARQQWQKKTQMKVQQHLREKAELDQLTIRCKLRIAGGYSPNDKAMNERILKRAKLAEDDLMRLVTSEFSPGLRTTALEIEVRPQSTSPLAHVGQKKVGIQ